MVEPSSGSSQPYRRHIVGLPLQRSLFGLTAQAATTIGLPGLSTELDFPARLDEKGDLFLNRSKVTALTQALRPWFTPKTLEFMHTTHAAACDALVDASENAARGVVSREGEARTLSENLANKLALVLAYGILSKFVPDVLFSALTDAGDVRPPPFPETSAGAVLMRDTLALYENCCALNYTPDRLRREWPHVSPDAFQLLSEFCDRQTGFGPLAWDSPGYEDPVYVVRLLHSAFDEIDTGKLRRRLSLADEPATLSSSAGESERVTALRRVLGFWLDFLERETWYARRAFYVGMIPLLHKLAERYRRKIPSFHATDLLFLEIDELAAGIVDPAAIQRRRHRYVENTEYLSLHGIDFDRLGRMLGAL